MNTQMLAAQIVNFLAHFLPHLLKAGDKTAEEMGEKLGYAGWEKAQALWGKLRDKEGIVQVAQDLAANPDDPDAQAALRQQLKKLLAGDDALAAEVAALLKEAQAAGVSVTASGERAVAIGGNVSGSVIITGDGAKVNASYGPLPGTDAVPPGTLMVCPEDPSHRKCYLQQRGQVLFCPEHGVKLVPYDSLPQASSLREDNGRREQ